MGGTVELDQKMDARTKPRENTFLKVDVNVLMDENIKQGIQLKMSLNLIINNIMSYHHNQYKANFELNQLSFMSAVFVQFRFSNCLALREENVYILPTLGSFIYNNTVVFYATYIRVDSCKGIRL